MQFVSDDVQAQAKKVNIFVTSLPLLLFLLLLFSVLLSYLFSSCTYICIDGYVCMAMYVWLCMYGYVLGLCMHSYVCMVMYVWLCMYGYVCMVIF